MVELHVSYWVTCVSRRLIKENKEQVFATLGKNQQIG